VKGKAVKVGDKVRMPVPDPRSLIREPNREGEILEEDDFDKTVFSGRSHPKGRLFSVRFPTSYGADHQLIREAYLEVVE
jgi:hypothetical protein